MKTLLGVPIRRLLNAIAEVKGPHHPVPCSCQVHSSNARCPSGHWHVKPDADMQGVSFTEEEANIVAGILNLKKAIE